MENDPNLVLHHTDGEARHAVDLTPVEAQMVHDAMVGREDLPADPDAQRRAEIDLCYDALPHVGDDDRELLHQRLDELERDD